MVRFPQAAKDVQRAIKIPREKEKERGEKIYSVYM